MDKDKFDLKMIDIEQKTFELGMLMSVFVFEILETFEGYSAEILAFINCGNPDGSFEAVSAERITLDIEKGEIAVNCNGIDEPVLWDDLDLAAKDIIINELHYKYKSEKLYKDFSDNGEVH